MKSINRQHRLRRLPGGFTLIEMTIAMVMSLGVASATMLLLSQQLSFIKMVQKFDFLRDDAPSINLLVSRIVGRATGYRLYATKAAAVCLRVSYCRD